MKVLIVLALIAATNAGQIVPAAASFLTRAPAFDSAIIKSDRLGGNFAYSVQEAHAYAHHTPIIQNTQVPVGVSYNAPAVQYTAHSAPAVQYAAHSAPVQAAAYSAVPAAYNYNNYAAAGIPSIYGHSGYYPGYYNYNTHPAAYSYGK